MPRTVYRVRPRDFARLTLWIFLIIGMAALAGSLLGCSEFQARGDAALSLDRNALAAPAVLAQVQAGTLTPDAAQKLLADNASTVQGWAEVKTTNVLAYWFGGKLILVNQDYSDDLDKAAVRFHSAQVRCTSQPADAAYFVGREETDFLKFKAARGGTKSPP